MGVGVGVGAIATPSSDSHAYSQDSSFNYCDSMCTKEIMLNNRWSYLICKKKGVRIFESDWRRILIDSNVPKGNIFFFDGDLFSMYTFLQVMNEMFDEYTL